VRPYRSDRAKDAGVYCSRGCAFAGRRRAKAKVDEFDAGCSNESKGEGGV